MSKKHKEAIINYYKNLPLDHYVFESIKKDDALKEETWIKSYEYKFKDITRHIYIKKHNPDAWSSIIVEEHETGFDIRSFVEHSTGQDYVFQMNPDEDTHVAISEKWFYKMFGHFNDNHVSHHQGFIEKTFPNLSEDEESMFFDTNTPICTQKTFLDEGLKEVSVFDTEDTWF